MRLTAFQVESERSGYHVVPARAGTPLASAWHEALAPSSPPMFPVKVVEVTKIESACVVFHGGVNEVSMVGAEGA